jgi:hypothetical protein
MIVLLGGRPRSMTCSRWSRVVSRKRTRVAGPGCVCWGCSRVPSGLDGRLTEPSNKTRKQFFVGKARYYGKQHDENQKDGLDS